MNAAKMPLADHPEAPCNAVDRIKAVIKRLESGSLVTGDNLGYDDCEIMAFIGYPSGIVTDGAKLLRLLNDKLVYLTNND